MDFSSSIERSKNGGMMKRLVIALAAAAHVWGCSSEESTSPGVEADAATEPGADGASGSGGQAGAGGASGNAGEAGADAAPNDAGGDEAASDAGDDVSVNDASDEVAPQQEAAADVVPEAPACTQPGVPALKLTVVAEGLSAPLFVVSPPGDPRLFVLTQGGTIRLIKDGVLLPSPFLDVHTLVGSGGERGLLGLAFHPDYQANGRFWIHYTDLAGDTVLAEYKRSASDVNAADPAVVRVVFTLDQPFANHNGGMIAFGPDGYLYMGLGDGGSSGDPDGNGQNLQVKLGKILRLDVDNYPVPPAGNVTGGDPQIWDWGLRNPWRFSFDRLTGDLYIADVGQNAWEEINVEPKGTGHRNYGWDAMEGTHCFEPSSGCSTDGKVLPVTEYSHADGCSVTGGYVYRGPSIPCLQGRYLYGDYCSNRVWSFVWNGSVAADPQELTAELDPDGTLLSSITSFGEDWAGEVYVTSGAGRVLRIEAE